MRSPLRTSRPCVNAFIDTSYLKTLHAGCAGVVAALLASTAWGDDAPELAKLVQNPIAKLISLPLQDNLTFGVGPNHDPQNVLEIEPVLPVQVSSGWNVITRAIVPLAYEPDLAPGVGNGDGLGDIALSLYLSPAASSSSLIWGVGPSFVAPTATRSFLGQGKWSAGLSVVALTIQGPWLVGALFTDVAAVAGQSSREDADQFIFQPFINYNLPHGWYLTSSPVVTANWKAPGADQWTVPVGGGGGRTFRIGTQAVNTYCQVFDDVVHPHDAGNWTLRLQFQLIFPK